MNPSLRHACGLTLLLGAALFQSCDKLDDPVIGVVPDCDTSQMVMPQFAPLQSDVQRILIEDFTAHQCGNCPPAGLQLAALVASHPDNIVPLAIHAGGLGWDQRRITRQIGPHQKAMPFGPIWSFSSTPLAG